MTTVTISDMIEKLMRRCVHETDPRVRLKLATCLGDETRPASMASRAAKYELQLVTKYLVAALRAAPSSEEQLKIAFAIQQLLVLLDDSVKVNDNTNSTNDEAKPQKREMSKWLLDRLIESKVYDSVEPFWSSEFSTKTERFNMKQPPFFNRSESYYVWISQFCRWMIIKAK
eukprot:CAMPEP_0170972524 /NCGR_PEP_ID=MMETSP0735-20130129/46097_1 /TAXON_ID=186038 /ORGANISM="Fragilariopsis kerguelensis, Strain L26-C5" /LENGTH=171 /DNA_ID=CAMNT_0011393145 /DNA_START=71 /DNA_END=584 /DNA_ORIENTATION=-